MFGPHLTLDLYGCDKKKISDEKFIHNLLSNLPESIGMHRISEPQITSYPGREGSFDKGGLSGFVLLAESHVTIHTFIADSFASVDIFSCKEFDIDFTTKLVANALGAKKIEKNLIARGRDFVKHYPNNILEAKEIVKSERKKLVKS